MPGSDENVILVESDGTYNCLTQSQLQSAEVREFENVWKSAKFVSKFRSDNSPSESMMMLARPVSWVEFLVQGYEEGVFMGPKSGQCSVQTTPNSKVWWGEVIWVCIWVCLMVEKVINSGYPKKARQRSGRCQCHIFGSDERVGT